MPFYYNPPQRGALHQGEILSDVWEHIVLYPSVKAQQEQAFPVKSVHHDLLALMSHDCDLIWDFEARFPDLQSKETLIAPTDASETLAYVLCIELHTEERIKLQISGTDIWRRIKQNQDERYHHLDAASAGNPPIITLPDLYIDFKKALMIPTQSLYEGLRIGDVKKLALIPDRYIHDLMHRFYSFLSRVSVPV